MDITNIINNLQYVKTRKKQHIQQHSKNSHTKQKIMLSFSSSRIDIKRVEHAYIKIYPELDECKLIDPKNISKVLKIDMLIRYSFLENHLSSVCTITDIVHDIRDNFSDPPKREDIEDFQLDKDNFIKKTPKLQYAIPIEYIVVKLYSKHIKLNPYTCFIFVALRKLGKKQKQIRSLIPLLKNMPTQTYNKRLTEKDPIDEVLKIIESNKKI